MFSGITSSNFYQTVKQYWQNAHYGLSSHWFNAFVALYFTTVMNMALWRFMSKNLIISGPRMAFLAVSMPIVIFTLLYFFFNLLFVPYITKPLVIFLLITASAVNYFMFDLSVIIDADMIRNTFETNIREASDLITLRMLAWFALGGILPSILVVLADIHYGSFRRELVIRVIAMVVSLVAVIGIAAFSYKDYAVFGRNNRQITKMISPFNYLVSTVKYFRHELIGNEPFMQLDNSAVLLEHDGNTPTVFILVVGETARANRFSLNGYTRNTNPELSREDVISYKNMYSCATATAQSVPCMFSNLTRENFSVNKAKNSENILDLMKQTGYDVKWLENDDGCKGVCDRVTTENRYKDRNNSLYCNGRTCFDAILLDGLEQTIASIKKDTVIVLHTIGSHGPTYYQRYPDAYRKFKPTCDTANVQNCTQEEIDNTYDNTILYTDHIVASAIGILKKFPQFESGLMYVSDHGESLGENNIFLHGMPYAIAPDEQKHIPMIIWMNENMKKYDHIDYACLAKNAEEQTYSHDNLFHSFLALLEIESKTYDKKLDLFTPCMTTSANSRS